MQFERNKVDNISQSAQQVAIAAEVRFDTGEVTTGQFYIQGSRPFNDVLNGNNQFIEFEVFGETRRWVSKSSIRDIKLTPAPRPVDLKARGSDIDVFDPYRVLGIEQGAAWADVRASYVNLSKIYHPDRFASVSLPTEVNEYLSAVSRRINLAYAALETKHNTIKVTAERAKPIFESVPRM